MTFKVGDRVAAESESTSAPHAPAPSVKCCATLPRRGIASTGTTGTRRCTRRQPGHSTRLPRKRSRHAEAELESARHLACRAAECPDVQEAIARVARGPRRQCASSFVPMCATTCEGTFTRSAPAGIGAGRTRRRRRRDRRLRRVDHPHDPGQHQPDDDRRRRADSGTARAQAPAAVIAGRYSGAVRRERTSRTSWSLWVAGTISTEGERSAPLPYTCWSPGAWWAVLSVRVQTPSGAQDWRRLTSPPKMTVRAEARRARSAESSTHCASFPATSTVERVFRWAVHTSTWARVATQSHRRRSMPACAVKSWLSVLSITASVARRHRRVRGRSVGRSGDARRGRSLSRSAVVTRPPGNPGDVTPARLVEGDRVRVRFTIRATASSTTAGYAALP